MTSRFIGSRSMTFKAALIGCIVLILLVPLTLLRGLVKERSSLREEAYARVAEGWGGSTTVGGPVLIIPTERTVFEHGTHKIVSSDLFLLPSQLNVAVALRSESEPRYVGIYAVPVYQAEVKLEGHFSLNALESYLGREGVTYRWDQARLHLPLSQSRSLREVRHARLDARELSLRPASPGLFRGVESHIDLSTAPTAGALTFAFDTVVAGSREFSVLPLGSTSSINVSSDWPHPAFQGGFLPVERSVSPQGFEARWQVLELNRSFGQAWQEGQVNEATLLESSVSIGFYQAVDIYQRAERAIKYALLFIALTFLTFFAWEQLSGLRLHPLQYLLVGAALSMFYVLLIALSEHIRFVFAYGLSSVALVTLMAIYISGALQSARRGLAVGGAMAMIYGLLYALILSEDYALLFGALTLFGALAGVMIATRRIDWYRSEAST